MKAKDSLLAQNKNVDNGNCQQPIAKPERKYYIDNLRSLCILLLFPFHSAMIFVDFDESFYVHIKNCRLASFFNLITYPWWMCGLFALAGISTVYALRYRSSKQYIKERFLKLFIPLLSAIVFIVPVQTYIADKFFNGYQGNYFSHFKTFFSVTDFSGYDGHFTPGHTWFILYLFVISLVFLPLMMWYKNKKRKLDGRKMTILKILPLFIPIAIGAELPEIGGKGITEFAVCFLLGYFVLSSDEVQERLEKHCMPLAITWVGLMIFRCITYQLYEMKYISFETPAVDITWFITQNIFKWIGILAIIGLAKRYLKFHNKVTQNFAAASFPVYLIHQSAVVVVGYIVAIYLSGAGFQYIVIVIGSFVVTMLIYWACKQFCVTRFLLGIKKK